jgi:hypothetical protein
MLADSVRCTCTRNWGYEGALFWTLNTINLWNSECNSYTVIIFIFQGQASLTVVLKSSPEACTFSSTFLIGVRSQELCRSCQPTSLCLAFLCLSGMQRTANFGDRHCNLCPCVSLLFFCAKCVLYRIQQIFITFVYIRWIRISFMKKLRAIEIRECLLSFGAEYFVFRFVIQRCKNEDIHSYNLACCFIWL